MTRKEQLTDRQKEINATGLKGRHPPPPHPCSLTCSIITIAGVVFQVELQRNIFSTGIDLWQGNLTHGTKEDTPEELTETKCSC